MEAILRRLMFIPAFALFLAVPLWAQHGGGGHGGGGGHAGGGFGGGHAGFSGGHSSSGGSHVSGGVRSAPRVGGVSPGIARGPAFSPRTSTTRAFSRPLNRPFLHDSFRGSRRSHVWISQRLLRLRLSRLRCLLRFVLWLLLSVGVRLLRSLLVRSVLVLGFRLVRFFWQRQRLRPRCRRRR